MEQADKPYKGNPSFPNENPERVSASGSTNDTKIYYILDPDGQAVTLGDVKNTDGTTNSALSGQTINTPKYGRFVNINVTSGELYVYPWRDGSGTN